MTERKETDCKAIRWHGKNGRSKSANATKETYTAVGAGALVRVSLVAVARHLDLIDRVFHENERGAVQETSVSMNARSCRENF